jgi:hypothetical protein
VIFHALPAFDLNPTSVAINKLLLVMDVSGPEMSVTLCRTYRRIRWSAPVWSGGGVDRLAARLTWP